MKILTIGGGTAHHYLLLALRLLRDTHLPNLHIRPSPATTDSGGSSLYWRKLNLPAPGDIAQCVYALLPDMKAMEHMFTYRAAHGELQGHTLRNILVGSYFEKFGPTQEALDQIGADFKLVGRVVPGTLDASDVFLHTTSGLVIVAEHTVYRSDLRNDGGALYLRLSPAATVNPAFVKEAEEAQVVIVSAGGLRVSTEPCLLVRDVPEVLQNSKALKVYVANLVQQPTQVPEDWSVPDYVKYLEDHYLGEGFFDAVICNTGDLPDSLVREGVQPVLPGEEKRLRGRVVVRTTLLAPHVLSHHEADALAVSRSPVRHDPVKVAAALEQVLVKKQLL